MIGTPSGLSAQRAQVDMMCRLKDAIEKLDKNTTRWSKTLTFVTIALLVIAIVQLVLSIFLSGVNPIVGLVVEIVALGAVVFFMKGIHKDFFK